MKTKKVNLRTILHTTETNTKFGLVKRIAFVQGSNKNDAHFILKHTGTTIEVKRIARWRNSSIYN